MEKLKENQSYTKGRLPNHVKTKKNKKTRFHKLIGEDLHKFVNFFFFFFFLSVFMVWRPTYTVALVLFEFLHGLARHALFYSTQTMEKLKENQSYTKGRLPNHVKTQKKQKTRFHKLIGEDFHKFVKSCFF